MSGPITFESKRTSLQHSQQLTPKHKLDITIDCGLAISAIKNVRVLKITFNDKPDRRSPEGAK